MDFLFQGKCNPKLYAITITSRNANTRESFVAGLTQFLKGIKYPCRITGNIENHKRKPNQVHLHGTTSWGQPPKNNKHNEYYFHLKKLDTTPELWYEYMYKDFQLTTILFDD